MRLVSWNINSAKTKLEKNYVLEMVESYDIVSLNEIKTSRSVGLPGYVYDMDTTVGDQVWFKLMCIAGVLFGCCYGSAFSSIQAKLKQNENLNGFVLMGDFNACFGNTTYNLATCLGAQHLAYPEIPDHVRVANDNATAVFGLCVQEKMVILKNLRSPTHHFHIDLACRQGGQWTSELDVCIVSTNILNYSDSFEVNKSPSRPMPSDRAPISVDVQSSSVDVTYLSYRALAMLCCIIKTTVKTVMFSQFVFNLLIRRSLIML